VILKYKIELSDVCFFSGNGKTEEKENKRFEVTWALEPHVHCK